MLITEKDYLFENAYLRKVSNDWKPELKTTGVKNVAL